MPKWNPDKDPIQKLLNALQSGEKPRDIIARREAALQHSVERFDVGAESAREIVKVLRNSPYVLEIRNQSGDIRAERKRRDIFVALNKQRFEKDFEKLYIPRYSVFVQAKTTFEGIDLTRAKMEEMYAPTNFDFDKWRLNKRIIFLAAEVGHEQLIQGFKDQTLEINDYWKNVGYNPNIENSR